MARKNTVSIVGAGLMGSGIAARSVLAGHPTVLIDPSANAAAAGSARAMQNIAQLPENGLVDDAQGDQAQTLLTTETEVRRIPADTFLVIEAITEKLALKQALFQQLDDLLPPDVMINQ